jgi:hypothetical protein
MLSSAREMGAQSARSARWQCLRGNGVSFPPGKENCSRLLGKWVPNPPGVPGGSVCAGMRGCEISVFLSARLGALRQECQP